MFTIDQIRAAHRKVKSGADFPSYVQEIKKLGVYSYDHYVADGHIEYDGANNFKLVGDRKWSAREIASAADIKKLKQDLSIHQQGGTDYLTFCKQAAEAGVEKWKVDMRAMKCIYYGNAGIEMLVEKIPQA